MTGKDLIVSKVLSKRLAFSLTTLVLVGSLISSWLTSLNLFLLVASMAFLGTIYSAPPFRLKMKYPFSTLIQLIGCYLPFLAGVAALISISLEALILSSVFCFLAVVHRFDHEIHFFQADMKTSKKTIAVVKGVESAKKWRATFLVAGLAESVFLLFLNLASLVFFVLILVYVALCINSFWSDYLPKPLKAVARLIINVSGLLLLLVGLYAVSSL
jgi:4-hydroxybenzoate polyprenyltransferase